MSEQEKAGRRAERMPREPAKTAREGQAMMNEPVDLNAAGFEELRAVKGIGDARAERIIAWRERNGPFQTVDDLQHVPDFPPEAVAAVREHVRV